MFPAIFKRNNLLISNSGGPIIINQAILFLTRAALLHLKERHDIVVQAAVYLKPSAN